MNTMTVHIPEQMVLQAQNMRLYHEQAILLAFQKMLDEEYQIKSKRVLGGAEGTVLYMADDFDAPLDDFKKEI